MKYIYTSAKNTAMSTNTPEAKELLRLYKCVVDTGTDVLTAFAKYKLLPTYNGNFKHFLDDKKHELFHFWQSRKLLSCECPPAGCNLKQTGHMPNWIFKKMYDDNGPEDRGHIIRNNSRHIVQVCLHKYVTRNIAIHELDISTISFLLRNLAILSQNETTSLDLITTTRSQICHAYSTNCYPMALLNTTWTELENALVDLVDPSFKRIIRKDIKQLRKADLEKEEITELMKNVEEVKNGLEAIESSCNNNINHFKGMESRLENMSITNTEDIKHHTTEQTNFVATQAQHAISEKIQNTKEKLEHCIRHEAERMNESQASSFQQLESTLLETRTQIEEVKENQDKTQGEILRAIKNLTLSVKYERPTNLLVPEETFAESMECPVLWQIATPEHWNLEAVIATLRNPSNKDEQFKKKFVRKGSLIMLTTIAASILSDPEAFETAVIAFLTKMITDCDIDTAIPSRVDVRLHILNANEVSMSCELPHQIQQTQVSGIKRNVKESKKIDVAFLNGDDEKEIKWIQDLSIKLETEFDIKCAILAKEYLHGFPIKKRFRQYINMFQVIILILTKDNYKQYDLYIEDDMPVLAVELEYINQIRLNLCKCPYINCSTCEHLWFPQLIDVLKTKLPDHVGKKLEMNTEAVNLDHANCRKCEKSESTEVYHKVGFINECFVNNSYMTFCGSLIDETWILNLLNRPEIIEPFQIVQWKKQLEIPFSTEPSCMTFFLVSNHFPNRPPFVPRNTDPTTVCWLKISNTKNYPTSNPLGRYIDATNMDQKEVAQNIFLLVAEDDSVDGIESFEKTSHVSPKIHRPRRSDNFISKIESLKNITQDERTGESDDSEPYATYEPLITSISDDPQDGYKDCSPYITPNASVIKDRSVLSAFSFVENESLKQQSSSVKKEGYWRSDEFVDKIDRLKNTTAIMQTDLIGESDYSKNGYTGYSISIKPSPVVEDDRAVISDEFLDKIDCLTENTSVSIQTDIIGESVSSLLEVSSVYERRSSNKSNTSMEKEEVTRTVSPPSEDSSVNERRSSNRSNSSREKEKVNRRDSDCIIL